MDKHTNIITKKSSHGNIVEPRTTSIFPEDAVNEILNAYFEAAKSLSSDTTSIEVHKEAKITGDTNEILRSARDYEKDVAREVFTDQTDWRDATKINAFLKRTKDLMY